MVSLLTNTSAMSALRVLKGTQKALFATENQISTGLRVSGASDDSAYWSIGTMMKARAAGLTAVQDSLNLTKSIADVSYAAVKSVITHIQQIQKDVVSASEPSVDKSAVQADIAARQRTILSTVQSASFNGINWLTQSAPYRVQETITRVEDRSSITKAQFDANLPGTHYAMSWSLDNAVSVTDPDGNISAYDLNQPSQTFTITVNPSGTSVASGISGPPQSVTQSISSAIQNGINVPTGMGDGGIAFSAVKTFGLTLLAQVASTTTLAYTQIYQDQTRHDYGGTYASDPANVGTAGLWGNDTSGGPVFMSKVLPQSPLTGILNLDVTNPLVSSQANQHTVSTALSSVMNVGAQLGSLVVRIGVQSDFNGSLSDALTSGIGSLIDADMNLASTRLQALQTQQQLGIQALSMANDNSKQILKLFG